MAGSSDGKQVLDLCWSPVDPTWILLWYLGWSRWLLAWEHEG